MAKTPVAASPEPKYTKITILINKEEKRLLKEAEKRGIRADEAVRLAFSVWAWALQEVQAGRHLESSDKDGGNRQRVEWAGGIGA